MKMPPIGNRSLLFALFAVLLLVGILLFRHSTAPPPPSEVPAPPADQERQTREFILYFGTAEGRYLEPEVRETEDCREEAVCVEETVRALLEGPKEKGVAVLPPQATLHGSVVEDGTATLDFSRELVTDHPGGSMSELLTVYALANTVAANFPHLRQVRILVEGQEVETLRGHVDLRRPVQADFSFSRSPSGGRKDAAGISDVLEDAK